MSDVLLKDKKIIFNINRIESISTMNFLNERIHIKIDNSYDSCNCSILFLNYQFHMNVICIRNLNIRNIIFNLGYNERNYVNFPLRNFK